MDWGDVSGGFINDSVAEEPTQLTNSVSVIGEQRNKSIAAVTISQIAKLTRPNEGLVLHEHKIYHVNLVAMVCEILDINSQKIHVQLDDYTSGGPLEVNHIIGDTGSPGDDPSLSMFTDHMQENNISQPKSIQHLKTGDYVRCIGVVKFNQDKPSLVAYSLKIIEDPNEVTVHTLEVIRDSLWFERLQSNGGVPPVDAPRAKDNSVGGMGFQNQQANNFGSLSTRDKHLLAFLKEKAPSDGMKLDAIAESFKAFSKKDIQESLSTLSAEGLCWQGDSEDLWIVESK